MLLLLGEIPLDLHGHSLSNSNYYKMLVYNYIYKLKNGEFKLVRSNLQYKKSWNKER